MRWATALGLLLACDEVRAADTNAPVRSLVVLGDSLSAGFGVDPSEAWPALVAARIRESGLPYALVNAGVSGDTTAGGLRRLEWLLRRRIDVLLLELGGNDGLRGLPPEATRTNLQAAIDRTRARWPEARFVVAGMKVPANMGADYAARFEAVFPALAATNGAVLVPFLLEGVGGRPELNLPDQIHPTPAGHRIVASNVWSVLGPLLTGAPGAPADSHARSAAIGQH